MSRGDPAAAVAAAFRRIEAESMTGLPMLNAALSVEAVDFDVYENRWLGVLITPWSMSLMLLPAGDGWVGAPDNGRLMLRFPAGELAFLGGREPEIGEYLSCSLFTTMAQFADQEAARLTARACRVALLQAPPAAETPASPARRGFLTGRKSGA